MKKEALKFTHMWETFLLLPSGKEFVRLHTQKTRRCVSGPGLEAAGLLYCSRWCAFSIYKKTLHVGSKEEVLSSIPASNTVDLLCGSMDGHVVWMQFILALLDSWKIFDLQRMVELFPDF